MKKFLLLCCTLATALFFTISCSKDEPNTPSSAPVGYFHLAPGSNWIYTNDEFIWDSGIILTKSLGENDTLTLQSEQQVLGKDAMLMQHHFLTPIVNTVNNATYPIYEDEAANKLYVGSDFMKIFFA